MLKTIRNAIVGMMNRLRMLRSLRPRLAASERESSLVRAYAVLLREPCPALLVIVGLQWPNPGPQGRQAFLAGPAIAQYRLFCLKVFSQSSARPLRASSAVPLVPTMKGYKRLFICSNSVAYSGVAQKSLTINML